MEEKYRIAILDDEAVWIDAIVSLLERAPEIEIVGTAMTQKDAAAAQRDVTELAATPLDADRPPCLVHRCPQGPLGGEQLSDACLGCRAFVRRELAPHGDARDWETSMTSKGAFKAGALVSRDRDTPTGLSAAEPVPARVLACTLRVGNKDRKLVRRS